MEFTSPEIRGLLLSLRPWDARLFWMECELWAGLNARRVVSRITGMSKVFSLENGEWTQGEPLGSGGYGDVYAAWSNGVEGALKLVPKVAGARRELLFDLPDARNVVPIIDRGETDTHLVLVMPRADKSLHEHLCDVGGILAQQEAVPILLDIARALADLDGEVVHRDIKPQNILLLDGHWCISDFGIARYAEAKTSAHTHKFSGSPEYLPPERWNGERATSASDIYSFGVVAFEIFSGRLPFQGPADHEFHEQHLRVDPPEVQGVAASLASLVDECLMKSPNARPTAANVVVRLEKADRTQVSPGLRTLQDANRLEVRKLAEVVRAEELAKSETERRNQLAGDGIKIIKRVMAHVVGEIAESAPIAKMSPIGPDGRVTLALGEATLMYSGYGGAATIPQYAQMPFDVVLHSGIQVAIPGNRSGYRGRSHSLWFCDAQEKGSYRWFETAFFDLGTVSGAVPFALAPDRDAALAVSPTIHTTQVAWPFTPIEMGDLADFIDRWALWFGQAARGDLSIPSNLPERQPDGSWRRS